MEAATGFNFQVCQIRRELRCDIGEALVTKVTSGFTLDAGQTIIGKICTRGAPEAIPALRSMFADGIPVRRKDFSQSELEGPRMLPSL